MNSKKKRHCEQGEAISSIGRLLRGLSAQAGSSLKMYAVHFINALPSRNDGRRSLLFSLLLLSNLCFSQDDDGNKPDFVRKDKGFHIGVYVGAYFANKYTASLYDGYGYDYNFNKNNFANSWINIKINQQYGAGGAFAGQTDQIANALGVQHGQWFFDESCMPKPGSLKYNISPLVGIQTRYCFDNNSSLILNVNGSRLTVNGAFQFVLNTPSAQPNTPGVVNYKTCSIVGGEQRMMFQMGYQRIAGDDPRLNFLWEIGPIVTLTKFEKSLINVNGLIIPLTTFTDPYHINSYNARNLTGIGFGAFAGAGLNITINPKWTVQFIYNPSFENIKLGPLQGLKLQHAVGFRSYYNF